MALPNFPGVVVNKRKWGADFGLSAAYKATAPLFEPEAGRFWTGFYLIGDAAWTAAAWATGAGNATSGNDDAIFVNTGANGLPAAGVQRLVNISKKIGKYHCGVISNGTKSRRMIVDRYNAAAYDRALVGTLVNIPPKIPREEMAQFDGYFASMGQVLNINPQLLKIAFVNRLGSVIEATAAIGATKRAAIDFHRYPGCTVEGIVSSLNTIWGVNGTEMSWPYSVGTQNLGDFPYHPEYSVTQKRKSKRKSKKRRSRRNYDDY
jgi:hypothetical protein